MLIAPHRWLSILEQVMEKPEKIVKEGEFKRTAKVSLSPWEEVCVNEAEWSIKKKLFAAVQPFRRNIFWNNLLELHRKDVPPITPPLLYLEIRKGYLVERSYLITKWAEGESLGQLITETAWSSEDDLIKIVKRATEIVSYLHNLGFVHGNLKWSNILIDPSRPVGIVLSDLERIKRSASFSDHGKDLARFVFSAYEHGMEREVGDKIVSWYFWAAGYRPEAFDRGLLKNLAKWDYKYGKKLGRWNFSGD